MVSLTIKRPFFDSLRHFIHKKISTSSAAHKTSHRLGYHGPQSSYSKHVLSLKKDNKDALDHRVEGFVQVLHVEGERVVDEGDVQLRDLRLACLVALGVGVNRDL